MLALFLDVDGVLLPLNSEDLLIPKGLSDLLGQLRERLPEHKLVWASAWWNDDIEFIADQADAPYEKVDFEAWSAYSPDELRRHANHKLPDLARYLREHDDLTCALMIDDEVSEDAGPRSHFGVDTLLIRPNSTTGLSQADVDRAVAWAWRM